jgi:bifunctional enzyme CysN/CysC
LFLEGIGISAFSFIPVSGMNGDNILAFSKNMLWYDGQTVLQTLDGFVSEESPEDKPFRMSVQDIYKFTNNGDDRRIIAGTVETGTISVGDEVVFYPSGKTSKIASIEAFNAPKQTHITSGFATGFTLQEQIYVKKGELIVAANAAKPKTTSRFKTNIFWLGNVPLQKHKKYILKLLSAKVLVEIEEIITVLDAASMTRQTKQQVSKYEAAQCILKADKAIAFDEASEILQTSRFVLVDDYEISGGGIIQQALEDEQSWVREKVQTRNYKWIKSGITKEQRAERYKQKAALVLITGKKAAARKELARALEKNLFEQQKFVYYIGMGSIVYGLNADIKSQQVLKQEHIRRLAETANILLDAGVILVVTAVELLQSDIELIQMAVNTECIHTVWLGESTTTELHCDLILSEQVPEPNAVDEIKALLKQHEIL